MSEVCVYGRFTFMNLSGGEPDSPVAESGEEYNEPYRLIDVVEFSDSQKWAGNQRLRYVLCISIEN